MENSFYSLIFRQKYIRRWGLMRSTHDETLAEHASEVAIIAHAIAIIGNKHFGRDYDTDRVLTIALFHDVSEVYTGDLPTPIKYHSQRMRDIYRDIESESLSTLLLHLPEDLRDVYSEILYTDDEPCYPVVKAADKLCAYIKCIDEEKIGNYEFISAKEALFAQISEIELPEVKYFVEHFLPTFYLSLDEMQN